MDIGECTSSVVTGLSLQTKIMSAGGLASALGRSPTISSTSALFSASSLLLSASMIAASLVSSVGFQSSSNLSPYTEKQVLGISHKKGKWHPNNAIKANKA